MSPSERQSWTPPPRTVSKNHRTSFTPPKRSTSLMPAPDSPTQLKWLHRRTGASSSGGSNGTPRWVQVYPVSRWRRKPDDAISNQLWEIEINSIAAVFERDSSILTFPNAVVRKYMPSKGRLSVYNATGLDLPPRGTYTPPNLSAPDLRAEQISLQSSSSYSRTLGRSRTHRRQPKRPSAGLPMRSNTIGHSAARDRQNSTVTDDDDFRATHMSDNEEDDDEFDEDYARSGTVWVLPRGSVSFLDVVRRSPESFVVVHEDFCAPEENAKPVNLSMLFAPSAVPAISHRVALARLAVAGVEPVAPSPHFQTLVANGSPMPSMSRTASIVSTPSTSSGPSTLVDDGEWENTAAILGAGVGPGTGPKRCYRVHLQEAAAVDSGKINVNTVTYKVNVYGSSLAEFIEALDPEGWEAVAL